MSGSVTTGPDEGDSPARHGDLAQDFADRFRSSFRVLWLIANGVVGDASLAEDVVQESAMIALDKLDQFQPGTNFTAWIGRIVRNVALNKLRRERKHRAAHVDPEVIDQTADHRMRRPPAEAPRDGSLRIPRTGLKCMTGADPHLEDCIMAALAGVGEVARACLLLRTIEGLPYARIAQLLEIPEGTAMSHVHRTRRFLRQSVAEFGVAAPGQESPRG